MHFESLPLPAFEAVLLFSSVIAGILGAILGLGGGLIVIPVLNLLFNIPLHYAVGASIVSVIATSSGAAAVYVKDRMTNVRLAILLEIATTSGAMIGATIAAFISPRYLYFIFAVVLLHSALMMLRKRHEAVGDVVGHHLSHRLRLNSTYPDRLLDREVAYQVAQVPLGFFYMLLAGVLSALLGIGSGILKVLAMDTAMKLPIKVSSATSNFMIGVTAAASAGAYFLRGEIVPELAAPIALGILIGAALGTRLMPRLPAHVIRKLFTLILVFVAVQMALRGWNWTAGGVG